MLKLAIAMLIFIVCSYVGFQYGEVFKKRSVQIREMVKSLNILQNYILYGTMPLPEAFELVAEKVNIPFSNILINLAKSLYNNDVESVYSGIVAEYKKYKEEIYLSDDDLKIMSDFFRSLGESGVYGQEKIFSLAIENLKMNVKDSDEQMKKYVKLYRYLGACIGGMIGIFILWFIIIKLK